MKHVKDEETVYAIMNQQPSIYYYHPTPWGGRKLEKGKTYTRADF